MNHGLLSDHEAQDETTRLSLVRNESEYSG